MPRRSSCNTLADIGLKWVLWQLWVTTQNVGVDSRIWKYITDLIQTEQKHSVHIGVQICKYAKDSEDFELDGAKDTQRSEDRVHHPDSAWGKKIVLSLSVLDYWNCLLLGYYCKSCRVRSGDSKECSAKLTTLCRALRSWAAQLPCWLVMPSGWMLSTAPE